MKPILGMEAYVAGPKGRKDRTERVGRPPHPPREERGGLGEPPLPLVDGVHGGLLLRPAHRQAAPARALEGPRRAHRLPRRRGAAPRCAQGDMDARARARRASTRTSSSPARSSSRCSRTGCPSRSKVNAKLAQLGRDEGIPLVATADAHYVKREDAKAHEVLMCIASGKTLRGSASACGTTRTGSTSPAPDEMAAALPDMPRGDRTTPCASPRCATSSSRSASRSCPRFQVPDGVTRGRLHREARAARGSTRASARSTASYPHDRDAYRAAARAGARRHPEDGVLAATSSSSRTSSTGRSSTTSRSARAAARARARSSRGRCASPTSTRSAGTCSSSASSTPSACRCRTSTSTSARTGATRSSSYVREKYGKNNVGQIITFGSLKAQIRHPRRRAASWACPFAEGDRIAKLVPDPVQGKTPPLKECIDDASRGSRS